MAPWRPSKIVCVGRNYREHASELGNEVPTNPALLKPPYPFLLPATDSPSRLSQRTDYEGELGVVIAKPCYKLTEGDDVRPVYPRLHLCQTTSPHAICRIKDDPWTRAKASTLFCPVGPVVTDESIHGPEWALKTQVNSEVRQDGNTRDFIFNLDVVLRYISQVMTLLPRPDRGQGRRKAWGPSWLAM
jgi:2-keto-4-pentenoate hydratase/2-oxohepta-3-ene-1,7-dioic acid hydratase in catechol pathway